MEIHLFDRSTGQKRQVTSGGGYEPHGPAPAWSADGKELFVPSEIIDASTGRTIASVLPRQLSLWSALSPDGRYFLAIEQGASGDLKGVCESPDRSRVLLWDRLTGSIRTVIDCGQPLFRPRWLSDSRHAALHVPNCWGCGPGATRVLLFDVEIGDVNALNGGLERDAYAFPSTQGEALVTGDRLRLYSAEGILLKEIEAPPGLHFTGAAWSPDGKRFAYIVGPVFSLL